MLFLCKSDFAEVILSAPFCHYDFAVLKIFSVAMIELPCLCVLIIHHSTGTREPKAFL